MPDITSHKYFIPVTTVVSMLAATISIVWYMAGVKSDLSIQIATIGQELKDHIRYTSPSNSISQR